MIQGTLKKIIDIFMDGEYHIVYRHTGEGMKTRQLRPTFYEWYADPIMYTQDGVTVVFMEVYDRFTDKGYIGVSEFDESGVLKRPRKVIDEPFHMSFPLTFMSGDAVYMMPETIGGGPLRIYRKGGSIYEWSQARVIDGIEGCVDSVVYSDDGSSDINIFTCKENPDNKLMTGLRWYILKGGADGECIDNSQALPDEYRRYGYDVRNGGPIIKMNGELFRVIQKSTERIYGESIEIRKLEISDSQYKETTVREISLADFDVSTLPLTTHRVGIHTYGCENGIEITDMFVARASLKNTARKIIKKIRKGR